MNAIFWSRDTALGRLTPKYINCSTQRLNHLTVIAILAARSSRPILIGNLSWMFHVDASGTLGNPHDSLLWYPVPRGGIAGFNDCLRGHVFILLRVLTDRSGNHRHKLLVQHEII